MSMGNYLGVRTEFPVVMATKETVGLDHLTVVPANFTPDKEPATESDPASREQ